MPAIVPETYLTLLEAFRLRPIRSESELDEATALANKLAVREDLTPDEEDYLEVLSGLIEAYEDVHYPMPDVSGPEMLQFLIEAREPNFSHDELAATTGIPRSTIDNILAGKQTMETTHIAAFAKYFHVSADVFLPD